jgi:dTDP-glucose pyrophosphorylase
MNIEKIKKEMEENLKITDHITEVFKKAANMKEKDTMSEWIDTQVQDSVVQSVINKFKQRSEVGIKKYNTTLDREDLTKQDWIQHAQEEAMDLILYLEKLKRL